jgi:serine/threonine protein kinase
VVKFSGEKFLVGRQPTAAARRTDRPRHQRSMRVAINYLRVRVLLYIMLVVFYTVEILYEDFSIGSSSRLQFDLRQAFGYTLLSLSLAALACCGARLDKTIITCDAALFALTIARVLLVLFAGFDGEAVFLALNVINIFVFPLFDFCARLDYNKQFPINTNIDEKIGNSNEGSETGLELKSQSVPDDQLYEGFRVRVDRLPEASSVATNLPWSTFTNVDHRIDSSSCHIYTAKWGERSVILKLIKADRISSPVAVAEFETEASVLSRLRHPHIVRFLGSGYQPRRFLVLELLDGGSLSHALGVRVDKDQRSWRRHFSYLDSLKLGRNMAGALNYLHNHWHASISIIHRDLKPDNIGFTSDGNIKLFDFGLCSVVRTKNRADGFNETYEMTGNTGTLRYMAPEVALGKPYNQSVDVYSFGIILWQITKAKVPFSGLGRRTYMENVVMGGERPRCDRKWPKAFTQLLQSCWHEDMLQRPSFSEVITSMDALILAEESSTKHRILRAINSSILVNSARFNRMLPTLFALSLLFLIGSVAYCIAKHSEVVGISLTIVSAFIFYVISISCMRYKPSNLLVSSGSSDQAFNPLQRNETTTSTATPAPQKKLHGIDFI